jgi:hypothetical protein
MPNEIGIQPVFPADRQGSIDRLTIAGLTR